MSLLLKIILIFHKIKLYFTPINYYYYNYNNGYFMNVSIIIYILNLFLVGVFIKYFIFNDSLYCVKNNKIWIYSKLMEKKYSKKIIKSIIYKDDALKINLNDIKKNIYNIDANIDIIFILYLYNKIIVNNKSYILINYFNNETKYLKILRNSKFNMIF